MAPNGYLHAGTVVTLADTACGYGCILNLPEEATGFTTIELKTNFLGTAREGMLDAVATAQHRGRTTQVWDAVVTHRETGRTIALFRCTQMRSCGRRRPEKRDAGDERPSTPMRAPPGRDPRLSPSSPARAPISTRPPRTGALPMVRAYGMDVVSARVRCPTTRTAISLVRSFASLARADGRRRTSSTARRRGARGRAKRWVSRIETYVDTLLWLGPAAIDDLRAGDLPPPGDRLS